MRADLADLTRRAASLATAGEGIVAVAGAGEQRSQRRTDELDVEIRRLRAAGASVRDIAATLAARHSVSCREVCR